MAAGRVRFLTSIAIAVGCATPAAPHPATGAVAQAEPTDVATAQRAPPPAASAPTTASSVVPTSSANPPGCPPDATPPAHAPLELTKFHSGPVFSAAAGTPPRAAIWTGQNVILFEGSQARELPAPHLPPGATVELFFGRDNQPRLLGFAPGAPGQEIPVYLRFRQGAFRPEPSELGPLGAPRGALYGVLGFADPEVVCRPRQFCLVKRTTGWRRVPAHDEPVRLILRGGQVFALHADRIEQLGEQGWSPVAPTRTFDHPSDVWLTPHGELWVVDATADGVFRLSGGRWEAVSSHVTEPRAVIGSSDHSVLVVGASGAAELEGTRSHCPSGVTGPLQLAFHVGDELWLAGSSGVYRSGK